MTDVKPSKFESIQICLFLSLLALGSNLFLTVNVVGDTNLAFGACFAFIGLLVLPISFALPIVICVVLSFLIGEPNFPAAIIFIAEFAAIAYLRKRNIFILIGAIIFWLSLGIPAMWVLANMNTNDIADSGLIISLQSAFNGLLNAAIAATVFACLPGRWVHYRIPTQLRLSSNIFTICASTLVLPLLIASFAFIYQGIHLSNKAVMDSLSHKSKLLDNASTQFIVSHQNTISQIAQVISVGGDQAKYQELMISLQENQQTFFNLATVSKTGQLGFVAPTKYNAQIANIPSKYKNIRDRVYFQLARERMSNVISDTIMSRGIVKAPMLAIASPITENNEFNGIVYGSINLFGLSSFNDSLLNISEQNTVVITDQNKRIVFSSHSSAFKALEPFTYAPYESKIIGRLPLMSVRGRAYIYAQIPTINDWNIYVLEPVENFSNGIKNQFIMVGIGLMVVLTIFLIFAYRLSTKITQPLIALLQDEEEFPTDELSSNFTSREISDMAKKLKRSSYLMRNFENRLKLQVEEKTEQLEQLNLQLAAQAREDGLTGLYNRSGFNELAINAIKTCYRIEQAFSVVLIDIDKFKNINDTYGHLLGDKCLIEFSNLMQQFCKRETDIIGRYGGEEFIIFLSSPEIQAQHAIINDIHEKTHYLSIKDEDSGENVSFTVSVGVCTVLSPVNLELSDLINIADDELYRCKRNGRDRVSISTLGA